MKRFFKWIFTIVIILIVLVVGAGVAVYYFVDPNEYKNEIVSYLKPYLKGRDLKIEGDLKLSLYPWTGVEVGKMIVGNAEGFVLKPFMTIEHAKVHIDPFSLLSDQTEVSELEIEGVKLNLQQDAEGRNNWSDLARTDTTSTPDRHLSAITNSAPVAHADAVAANSKFEIPKLKVHEVKLNDAQIILDDKKSKDIITITKLNINAGPINNFDPIPLKGQYNLHSKLHNIASASAFVSTLTVSPQLENISLSNLVLNTNVSAKLFSNKLIKTSLKIPMLTVNTAKETITAKPFTLKIDDMNSEGYFTLERFKTPLIKLQLTMETLDLDRFLPASPVKPAADKTTAATTNTNANSDIPTVDDILAGKDKQAKVDESVRLFAPLTVFSGTNAEGKIKIKNLKLKGVDFNNFKITMLARPGLIHSELTSKVYGGYLQTDVQINILRKPARISSRQKIDNINIGPVLKALTGKESMTGQLNYQGVLYSTGETQNALTENLSGDGSFNVKNAKLNSADVKRLVLAENYDKLSFIKEQDENKQVTAFRSLRGTLRVKEGIVYNKDLLGIAERLHLKGYGDVNLVEQTIKYTSVVIPKKDFGISVAGKQLNFKDKNILTHFKGPWSNIEVDNDLENVLKDHLKNTVLKQKKRELENEAKTYIEEETRKIEQKYGIEKDELENKFKDKLKKKLKI